eukprot:GHVH01008746.1.p1 GENE.GHVH01008746.1~~GHVH01008746.1.p1  ORF type:complete len:351 (+),score=48.88 GHVH01008746.1:200-1252(+)
MPSVSVNSAPNGYEFIKISKMDPVPLGAIPATSAQDGTAVKRCYYVPMNQNTNMMNGAGVNSYMPGGASTTEVPSYLPGANNAMTSAVPVSQNGYPQNGYPQNGYPGQGGLVPLQQQQYNNAPVPYQMNGITSQPTQQQRGTGYPSQPGTLGTAGSSFGNVITPGFTFPHQTKYLFKEEALGMNDANATVLDMKTNQPVVTIRGTYMRDIRGGHRILIAGGREVCQVGKSTGVDVKKMIMKELGLAKSGLCIFDMHEKKIASIAEKSFKMGADSTMVMADGREVILDASFRAKKFNCTHKGKTLFVVEHKTSAKSLLLGKDNYEITVEPGVDSLLAIATCLVLEDLFRGE